MGGPEETRIFVGGLSWETTERHLEDAFSRYGKVVEAQIVVDRDTGRPRGFGFVTFADHRAVDDAITDMHGQELDGRIISVNKAQPKLGSDGPAYGYGGGGRGGYSGGRGSYGGAGADRLPPAGTDECFKCGRVGHWARECPSSGGGGGGRFSSRAGGGRGDRFGGSDRYGDRYVDDRYNGGRYGERDRTDSRDSRYGGGRDRYVNDRYPPGGDRFSGDRYGAYGKERGYDRAGGIRSGSNERYGSGGPARYEGGGGYRERPGPYDRPSRAARPSSYEDRY